MINKQRLLYRIETASYLEVARAIANQDEINEYLKELGTSPIVQGHDAVKKWITTTLKKYLLNKHDDVKSYRPKPTDPKWLQDDDEPLTVVISPSFKQDIEHALGYLTVAKKPEFVTVQEAIELGEKLLEKQRKEASDDESSKDVKVLHEWDNGYRMLSLLTQQALAREGKIMGHCVGSEQQNYISRVRAGTMEVWSLRDAKNQPHATIEYQTKEKSIKQIKGKGNTGVVAKYVPYLKKFFDLPKIKTRVTNFDTDDLLMCGILEQDGVWYDLLNLPENFTVDGDLDLSNKSITELPKGLTVTKTLYLQDTDIEELPEGLTVGRNLMGSERLTRLPANLTVGVDLDITGSNVSKLPENLTVGRSFRMRHTKIKKIPSSLNVGADLVMAGSDVSELPEGFNVPSNLDIRETDITELPANLTVGGSILSDRTDITSIGDGLTVGRNFNLIGQRISELPNNITVGGDFDLSGTNITELPANLNVGKTLNISDTDVSSIPNDIKVGGDLVMRNANVTVTVSDLEGNVRGTVVV